MDKNSITKLIAEGLPKTPQEWIDLNSKLERIVLSNINSSVVYPYTDRAFMEHVFKAIEYFADRRLAAQVLYMNPKTWLDEIRVRFCNQAYIGTTLCRDFLDRTEAGEYRLIPNEPMLFCMGGIHYVVVPYNVFAKNKIFMTTPLKNFIEYPELQEKFNSEEPSFMKDCQPKCVYSITYEKEDLTDAEEYLKKISEGNYLA